jgi:predicted metalloprotease with PDZ domain
MAFTVSMEQPSNHLFHVVFRCEGLKADALDFKMPVWTPGFYSLLNYANRDIDYDKYLGYAGLQLEPPRELTNAWLGVVCEEKEGKLFVAAVESNSPAHRAGLEPQDEIKGLDGVAVDAKGLTDALAARKPGDNVMFTVLRSNKEHKLEATLDHKLERTFRIKRIPNPEPLQAEILRSWLKG